MTLLFDIELTWYQRSVTFHCSHYLQGLLFCLFFFCWNTHSHLPLPPSLWSLLLITFAVFPSRTQTPPPSRSLLEDPAPTLDDSQLTTKVSPLPDGPTHGILSAGPGGLQTKQAAPSQAQFIRGGWTWTSTIPAFLRQGPYKNYEHCMVMKISLEIDALHWIAIAASKDHLQLVLEIRREESDFSPVALCLWTCIKSGQTPGRVPASFMYNNLNQLNTSVIPKKLFHDFKSFMHYEEVLDLSDGRVDVASVWDSGVTPLWSLPVMHCSNL